VAIAPYAFRVTKEMPCYRHRMKLSMPMNLKKVKTVLALLAKYLLVNTCRGPIIISYLSLLIAIP
jgi:hypothetical protein